MNKKQLKKDDSSIEEMDFVGVDWKEIYKQLDSVFRERIRQNRKFGIQRHTPMHWIPILGEEFGEVCQAALENHFDSRAIADYEKEIIELIAVGFAMLESLHSETEKTNE